MHDRALSFGSIERSEREQLMRDGSDALGPYRDVAWADFLISSWYLWFRLRDGAPPSIIAGECNLGVDVEFASFDAFLVALADGVSPRF